MKKIITVSIVILFVISLKAFSQDKKAKNDEGKMHIKIEVEKDGKTTKVDTTINPEDLAALNKHLADMDIHIGSEEDFPMVHAFKLDFDQDKWNEEMKELQKQLDGKQIDMEDFQKQMEKLQEKMKDHHMYMYKFKTDGDSDTDLQLMELDKELDNLDNSDMNFNFNFNHDGKTKTITIDGDDIKIDGNKIEDGKGDKEIIIKSKSAPKGKDGKHKETKKVIIMKSWVAPEKQKAEFASEPAKDGDNENAARVRVVDKKSESWLNNLSCYPNPSSGEFTLSFRLSNPDAAELKIMDLAGREVLAENIPENSEWVEKQIKLPSNASAAYVLILRQGNNWYHEKIFVKS